MNPQKIICEKSDECKKKLGENCCDHCSPHHQDPTCDFECEMSMDKKPECIENNSIGPDPFD